ncbi:MAG TPA: hypothetical protein VMI53_14820 [Opitutaceae bacterium]|nr:hypothetical protein [Opitutaceae bacterium]
MRIRWKIIVMMMTGAAFATLVIIEARTHRRLTNELSTLRQQNQEMAQLRNDNERLNASVVQLQELRKSQIDAVLARQAAALPPASAPADRDAQLAAEFVSVANLKNAGTKTPKEAAETYLWALDRLETATLAKVLRLNDVSLSRIRALYASLPQGDQAECRTAEEMFAMIYASEHPIYFSAVQISADQPPSKTGMQTLTTQYEYSNGHITEHHDVRLMRTPDGDWGVQVPPLFVEQAIKQLDPKAPVILRPTP